MRNTLPYDVQFRPFEAWRAMRRLLADKDDTIQVFRILRALRGRSFERVYHRFRQDPVGARLLREKPSLIDALRDRAALARLPEGTLGRKYLAFIEGESLSPDELVMASAEGRDGYNDPDRDYIASRLRDMHDLWHVITGYGRDGLGELALLAFSHTQSGHAGVAFIVLMGTRKARREAPWLPAWQVVREGRRHGKAASWLVAQPWEELLAEPLGDLRARLNIARPDAYRAAMALAAAREEVPPHGAARAA
jgi:ubiquinone biosynthesis protein COQ4